MVLIVLNQQISLWNVGLNIVNIEQDVHVEMIWLKLVGVHFVYKYQPELYEDRYRGINLTSYSEDK
jgi:hypothetical protein